MHNGPAPGKAQGEGLDLLTLDVRDAFKQLHVVPTERPFLAGMDSSRVAQCCSEWDQGLWSGAGWPLGALKRGWVTTCSDKLFCR